jgi:hypothetical protein
MVEHKRVDGEEPRHFVSIVPDRRSPAVDNPDSLECYVYQRDMTLAQLFRGNSFA